MIDLYIGTYTHKESQGIYRCQFDPETGKLSEPELAAEAASPSFLRFHPDGSVLYAVNETESWEGQANSGGISAYAIGGDGLTLINRQATHGAAPCHVCVSPTGKSVYVANYTGGSIATFPVGENGGLEPAAQVIQHEGETGPNPRRQEKAHAHSVNLSSDGKRLYVADLGLDQMRIYDVGDGGHLSESAVSPVAIHPGSGPRHFDFHPDGRAAYVLGELDSTITPCEYDSEAGTLKPIQTLSTLPDDFDPAGNTCADVHVHPSGRFVFSSNRGHHSIARFGVEDESGELRILGHESTRGETPRNFTLTDDGNFLLAANQDSDNIVAFRVDSETGSLTPTGSEVRVSMPVCLLLRPPA